MSNMNSNVAYCNGFKSSEQSTGVVVAEAPCDVTGRVTLSRSSTGSTDSSVSSKSTSSYCSNQYDDDDVTDDVVDAPDSAFCSTPDFNGADVHVPVFLPELKYHADGTCSLDVSGLCFSSSLSTSGKQKPHVAWTSEDSQLLLPSLQPPAQHGSGAEGCHSNTTEFWRLKDDDSVMNSIESLSSTQAAAAAIDCETIRELSVSASDGRAPSDVSRDDAFNYEAIASEVRPEIDVHSEPTQQIKRLKSESIGSGCAEGSCSAGDAPLALDDCACEVTVVADQSVGKSLELSCVDMSSYSDIGSDIDLKKVIYRRIYLLEV